MRRRQNTSHKRWLFAHSSGNACAPNKSSKMSGVRPRELRRYRRRRFLHRNRLLLVGLLLLGLGLHLSRLQIAHSSEIEPHRRGRRRRWHSPGRDVRALKHAQALTDRRVDHVRVHGHTAVARTVVLELLEVELSPGEATQAVPKCYDRPGSCEVEIRCVLPPRRSSSGSATPFTVDSPGTRGLCGTASRLVKATLPRLTVFSSRFFACFNQIRFLLKYLLYPVLCVAPRYYSLCSLPHLVCYFKVIDVSSILGAVESVKPMVGVLN